MTQIYQVSSQGCETTSLSRPNALKHAWCTFTVIQTNFRIFAWWKRFWPRCSGYPENRHILISNLGFISFHIISVSFSWKFNCVEFIWKLTTVAHVWHENVSVYLSVQFIWTKRLCNFGLSGGSRIQCVIKVGYYSSWWHFIRIMFCRFFKFSSFII